MIGTKYLAVALVRCQQHQISCRTLRTTVPLSYRSWKGNKKLEDAMRQSGFLAKGGERRRRIYPVIPPNLAVKQRSEFPDTDKLLGEEFLELKLDERENETYVEAKSIRTGREDKLIEAPSQSCCVLCELNLRQLNYTDVMILSQFIKKDGSIATRQESKLCHKQYAKISRLIGQAQRCNLIERPPNYLVAGPWHDLNTYLEPDRRRDQPTKIIKKEYWRI